MTRRETPTASRLQGPALHRSPILIVPGLFNSAAGHRQSYWERALPHPDPAKIG